MKWDILHLEQFETSLHHEELYVNVLKDHLQAHREAIAPPHKHSFFLVVVFTQGEGVHEIDFERYPVSPGSVFFLTPGQIHHWELSPDADGIIFFHSQEYFDVAFTQQSVFQFPFYYSQQSPPLLQLTAEQLPQVFLHFENLLQEYRNEEAWMKRQRLSAQLSQLYIDLSREYLTEERQETQAYATYSEHLRALEVLIEDQYVEQKSPTAYAEQLHMTVRHLNRIVQEALGKTTTQLITERVILEAKRMLVQSTVPPAEIAETLGYPDYPYFSRLFKKWVGVSPAAFAKQYR
ncbi:MAG TPA: AraC family transcriptional regulator [Cytophagales bacterium]|nr:AraC family transcriptional regulator [Cytophagales bacterium]HAA24121.1 AraC family transcriptional regulator [Cytophagales bacterium]HAP58735.1 AraC family transcriptional regulator [Cytophagales bacterium]